MPNRAELRHGLGKHKRAWIVAMVAALIVVVVVVSVVTLRHKDPGQATSATEKVRSSKKVSKSHSSKKSAKVQPSKASHSSAKEASSSSSKSQSLVGLEFSASPVLYNGEDVDKAMDENRAPQNTVHDSFFEGYFKSSNIVRTGTSSMYVYPTDEHYYAANGYIHLRDWRIPYTIVNGRLETKQWTSTDNTGATITWELQQISDVKEVLDKKMVARANNAAKGRADDGTEPASSQAVDQHNLTSAQLEHWVRAIIKTGSDDYADSDYQLKQGNVDGYAVVFEKFIGEGANKYQADWEPMYRVNADGYLEAVSDVLDEWEVISYNYH
ncbi:hypothetical protein [Lacticaseibacillus hulanensis]|uniref:hypothetical protein n=1 Tax=Lacticaseibacillus hulanensis TaxID=2493111 RepID=UPI000FD7D604|nr:hypothetical protein [Lacticaseibacillus hulanensis]